MPRRSRSRSYCHWPGSSRSANQSSLVLPSAFSSRLMMPISVASRSLLSSCTCLPLAGAARGFALRGGRSRLGWRSRGAGGAGGCGAGQSVDGVGRIADGVVVYDHCAARRRCCGGGAGAGGRCGIGRRDGVGCRYGGVGVELGVGLGTSGIPAQRRERRAQQRHSEDGDQHQAGAVGPRRLVDTDAGWRAGCAAFHIGQKCARSRVAGSVPGPKEDSVDLIGHYSSAIQPLFGERRGICLSSF